MAARRIFFVSLGIVGALLVLHLTFQYLNLERYQEKQGQVFELSNRFDMDDEASLPTWFAQFFLLSIAGTAFLAGRLESARSTRRAWYGVAGIGLVVAIDEVAAIHELVLQTAHLVYYGEAAPTAVLNAWWLALPFILAAGLGLLWWLYQHLPKRTCLLLLIAGVTFLTGSVGFELFSNDVAKTSFLYQGVMTGAEESLEMLGSLIGLYAVVAHLESRHGDRLRAVRKTLHAHET